MRTCTKCGESKALEEFYTSRGRRYPSCKVCHNAHQRAYRLANRAHVREQAAVNYRKRTYALDPEAIEALVQIQGGTCAICEQGKPEWVDHDHKTGLVRGLLCKPCNWALGQLKDDPAVVERALLYLRYYGAVQLDEIHNSVMARNGSG